MVFVKLAQKDGTSMLIISVYLLVTFVPLGMKLLVLVNHAIMVLLLLMVPVL